MDPSITLLLPEILLDIAAYLTCKDHVCCLRVCKAWHRSFLPIIWKDVRVRTIGSIHHPYPVAMKRHCQYVVHLSMGYSRLLNYAVVFPELQKLSVHVDFARQEVPESDLKKMVLRNPSLAQLQFNGRDSSLGASFWSTLMMVPGLRSLSLTDGCLRGNEAILAFWELCAKLTSLHLVGTQFRQENHHWLATCSAPRQIRVLKLERIKGLTGVEQLALLSQCPHLQELDWHLNIRDMNVVFQLFAEKVASGQWPDLERIECPSKDGLSGPILGQMQDDDAARILKSLRHLTVLSLALSKFGLVAFQALRRHFGTLRELVVRSCPSVTSVMLVEILCSCPQLELLEGDVLRASDAVESAQWNCLALKALVVHFAFEDIEQDLQRLVFERLSKLTRLEKLHVGTNRDPRESYPNGLDFRLSSGLGALAKLKWITRISFVGTWQQMGVKDVQWMISTWKHLTVYGTLNQDPATCSALKDIVIHKEGATITEDRRKA